jgi:hypothetical protein
MPKFTPRQRAVLHTRIARELCWHDVPSIYRSNANQQATRALDAIEDASVHGMTLRRATEIVLSETETERSA